MGDIVTSIRLDEDKWKKAKIRAIEEGITLTIFLDEALDMRLSKIAEAKGAVREQRKVVKEIKERRD